MEENIKELRKENKKKFYIGQRIWFLKNSIRRSEMQYRFHVEIVEKIGTKYVTAESGNTVSLEDMVWESNTYGVQGYLFFSEQELLDYEESKRNMGDIRLLVSYEKTYTLEQTKQVLAILKGEAASDKKEEE